MSEDVAKKEQFLLLAKNAKGLALVDLITKATAEPGLFTFGEILSLPGVQEVSPWTRSVMGKEGRRSTSAKQA
jgi:COP9 signalosome complex subunit 7